MRQLALAMIFISTVISLNLSFAAEKEFAANDLEKLAVSLKLEPIDSENLTEIITKNSKNIQLIKITDPEMLEELNNIVKNQDTYSCQNSIIVLRDLIQKFESANEAKAQFLPAIPVAFYYGAIAGGALVAIIYSTIEPAESKTTIYHNETINVSGNGSNVQIVDNINTSDRQIIDISYSPDYTLSNISVSNLSAQVFSPSI
jgi:hypothetical protein